MSRVFQNVDRMDSDTIRKDVVREDFADLEPARWTDEGYLRFQGFVARPGIMEYDEGGVVVRVLVPPETLHSKAALDTLHLKPLTMHHPDPAMYPDQVTAENERDLAIGSTGERVVVRKDGRVAFSAIVRRADAIEEVRKMKAEGKILGLSPGYRCDEDCTPGVHMEYGAYDRIQTSRRYNHLAITDSPRGGPSVHFRIDESCTFRQDGDDLLETPMKNALIEALVHLGMKRSDAVLLAEKDEKIVLEGVAAQGVTQASVRADEIRMAVEAAKPKTATSEEIEAARLGRVANRKSRRILDGLAVEFKIDSDAYDDDSLKVEILKEAKVEIPKMDGVEAPVLTRVYFDAFVASRATVKPAGEDPVRDAFRFDASPGPVADLRDVYGPHPSTSPSK